MLPYAVAVGMPFLQQSDHSGRCAHAVRVPPRGRRVKLSGGKARTPPLSGPGAAPTSASGGPPL
eukprot:9404033-Lingulodinium_polyedra.AAC.1